MHENNRTATRRADDTPTTVEQVATGVAVTSLIVAALAAAKATGVVDWSWWHVTAPLWLAAVGVAAVFTIGFVGALLLAATRRTTR